MLIFRYGMEYINKRESGPEKYLASDEQLQRIVDRDFSIELPNLLKLRALNNLFIEQELESNQWLEVNRPLYLLADVVLKFDLHWL